MALPLPDHADTGTSLVVLGHADTTTVVLRTATSNPEHAVIGFTLPRNFEAMTVVAPSVLTSARSLRHRSGSLAVRMTRLGETTTHVAYDDGRVVNANAPEGWLVDACRRSMGLATHPPGADPSDLAIVLWLDRLMTVLVREHIDWPTAARLAPIPARWQCDDPQQLGIMLANNLPPWSTMRLAIAAGDPGPVALPRQWAQWMDDGMFARWCLGTFPDLDALRADIEFLAPPTVADGVAATLRAAHSS